MDKDGNYVKVGGEGKSSSKMAYLTMLSTRASMVSASGSVLAEAATTAIRYSAVRKQGFVEPSKAGFQDNQNKIIDYPIQRHRLLKALSQAVVMKAAGIRMIGMMGQANMDDLTELHATSSILKAHCTTMASHGIEQMRTFFAIDSFFRGDLLLTVAPTTTTKKPTGGNRKMLWRPRLSQLSWSWGAFLLVGRAI